MDRNLWNILLLSGTVNILGVYSYIICYCDTVECHAAGIEECKAEFYCYTVYQMVSTPSAVENSHIQDDRPQLSKTAVHEPTQTIVSRGCVTNDYLDMCVRPPYRTHSSLATLVTKCCRDAWCNSEAVAGHSSVPSSYPNIPVLASLPEPKLSGSLQRLPPMRAHINQEQLLGSHISGRETAPRSVQPNGHRMAPKQQVPNDNTDYQRKETEVDITNSRTTISLVNLFLQKPILFTFGLALAILFLVFTILLAIVMSHRQRREIRRPKCSLVNESYTSLPHVYVNHTSPLEVSAQNTKIEINEQKLWTPRDLICCCCRRKQANVYEFSEIPLKPNCISSSNFEQKQTRATKSLTAKFPQTIDHLVDQIPAIQQTSMWVKHQQKLNCKTTPFNSSLGRSSSNDTRRSPNASTPRLPNSIPPFNTRWYAESDKSGVVEELGSTVLSRPSLGTDYSDNTKQNPLYVNELTLPINQTHIQLPRHLMSGNSTELTTTMTSGSQVVHNIPEASRQRGTGATSSVGEDSRNGRESEPRARRESEQSGLKTSGMLSRKQSTVHPFVGLANFRRAEDPQEELVTPYAEVELSLKYVFE